MPKSVYFPIVLCVFIHCSLITDGQPRSKKTFVPIQIEPDESAEYNFLYNKHFISMRGRHHHASYTCWLYNTTAEEVQLVHTPGGIKLVELKVMQLASSQVGRVVSTPEAHRTLSALDNRFPRFCHTTNNDTNIIWLEDV
ncbi:uncharacterized protein LOC134233599 [Saccostrea cucullata]|uniref:uncharacterized protein LOC134233599 n=1 Tax=Saccostrea cuccullata TaxID=36930 RepID=UPI002ED3FA3B